MIRRRLMNQGSLEVSALLKHMMENAPENVVRAGLPQEPQMLKHIPYLALALPASAAGRDSLE